MAFDKFRRALTLFATSLLVFCYLHHFEMHARHTISSYQLWRRPNWSCESWETRRSRWCSSSLLLHHFSEAWFRCTQHL